MSEEDREKVSQMLRDAANRISAAAPVENRRHPIAVPDKPLEITNKMRDRHAQKNKEALEKFGKKTA